MYIVLVLVTGGRGMGEGEEGEGESRPRYRTGGLNNGSRKQFKSKVLKMVMYDPSTSRCWVWRGAVEWRD
jgi:hypothetical protein